MSFIKTIPIDPVQNIIKEAFIESYYKPQKPTIFFRMLSNIFFMRHFENIMSKLKGQQWIDYKNNLAV